MENGAAGGRGAVEVEKTLEGKVSRTWIQLTPRGREAVAGYWDRMRYMGAQARAWRPDPADAEPPRRAGK